MSGLSSIHSRTAPVTRIAVFGHGPGLPLLLAVVSIGIATGTATVIGHAFELNLLVFSMITMIGLAVGIDYSLFIVHRYREELKSGLEKQDAITRTGATAGSAVLFSGGTVVIGLLGMMIVPSNIYRSGAGARSGACKQASLIVEAPWVRSSPLTITRVRLDRDAAEHSVRQDRRWR
jgi:RND superfamily putative drug exporter